ncbi:MAG: flagellar assembly protein FliW [Acidobacteria bacterium]|nr:flagellar assembly protein FliW [Acidobacteriota bacterium]
MLIHTVNFGDLEVPEDKILTFKEGLPGFPQIHRFVVLELEEIKPFQYLQALDDPPITLFIINPFMVEPTYEFRLSETDMADVNSKNSSELAVYAVATIPENPSDATINLMAPIVINENERCGKQVILHESKYSVKHPLLQISGQNEAEAQGA